MSSKVDLSAARKGAEKEGHIGSGVFKLQEGANRVRVVSDFLPNPETYKGERRFKWLVYILDRADGQIKPFFMPHSIFKMIEALQQDPEYAFDEVPMPYDVTITAKGAGTREVEYSLIAARKSVPLTADETNALDEKQPIREFQKQLREKKATEQPEERPFDPDEMPA